MPNIRGSDGSIGSMGQAILRSDKYFTDGEMALLQNAMEYSLEARGFARMPNVRWSKYFTDGEMTLLQNAMEYSLEARGFARMPNVRWSECFTDGEMT